MKKVKLILTGLFILILSSGIISQPGGGPPDPPGGHGSGNDEEPGGGAPIGSGVFVLLGLALAYGGKKAFDLSKTTRNNKKI